MFEVERYHDISAGHRVVGHEGKCRHLHGHNYRIFFTVVANDSGLDSVGRVIDFGVIKTRLCEWVERTWDHKMLLWEQDPFLKPLQGLIEGTSDRDGIVPVPFNPTAENMARHLVEYVGPIVFPRSEGLALIRCRVEETRKCSATYVLPEPTSMWLTNLVNMDDLDLESLRLPKQ